MYTDDVQVQQISLFVLASPQYEMIKLCDNKSVSSSSCFVHIRVYLYNSWSSSGIHN